MRKETPIHLTPDKKALACDADQGGRAGFAGVAV